MLFYVLFIGSDTLNKWHHLASKNIKGGLDISSEEKQPPDMGNSTNSSIEDFDISVINREADSLFEVSNMDTSTDDGISVSLPVPKSRIEKSSSPQGKPVVKPRRLIDLSTPYKKTIITRNSSALKSLRQGRSLLNSQQKGGRSQADVIDMIAAAMGKVNVEAKAGQRILSSLNLTPTYEREINGPVRADYTSMPNVAKALEKAAQINEKVELEKSSKILFENDSSNYDSGTEELNYSTVTSSEYTSTTRSSSTHTSSTRTPETNLHSVTGPLGLLNRANPAEPSPDIMNNLLRYSATQNKPNINIDSLQNVEPTIINTENETNKTNDDSIHKNSNSLTTLNKHEDDNEKRRSLTQDAENEHRKLPRNMSGGSLVDMIANTTRKSRPLGLSNLVSRVHTAINSPSMEDKEYLTSIDGPEPEIGVDDKTRTKVNDANSISQSMETGLDSMKEGSSGIFGFFSFLGKLS